MRQGILKATLNIDEGKNLSRGSVLTQTGDSYNRMEVNLVYQYSFEKDGKKFVSTHEESASAIFIQDSRRVFNSSLSRPHRTYSDYINMFRINKPLYEALNGVYMNITTQKLEQHINEMTSGLYIKPTYGSWRPQGDVEGNKVKRFWENQSRFSDAAVSYMVDINKGKYPCVEIEFSPKEGYSFETQQTQQTQQTPERSREIFNEPVFLVLPMTTQINP